MPLFEPGVIADLFPLLVDVLHHLLNPCPALVPGLLQRTLTGTDQQVVE